MKQNVKHFSPQTKQLLWFEVKQYNCQDHNCYIILIIFDKK